MLQSFLCRFFAKRFYPTKEINWYKNKGYKGKNDAERFANFIAQMRLKSARFYQDFLSLKFTRQYIPSGNNQLDSVLIVPDKEVSKGKPGFGLYFVMFFGRSEPYEIRFRDMARQAKETGASVLGFNPKGHYSSTGKTECLLDIVKDGIAVIDYLLRKGVQYEKIILQGNSLGAGVQEMVSEHYKNIKGKPLYQINSNSFRSLSAVMAYYYRIPFLEKLFYVILKYAKWEISPGADFYKTGPYRCHIHRIGDMTIMLGARYHSAINFKSDRDNCPPFYKETHKWLYNHSQIIYRGNSKKDPHKLSLCYFDIKDSNGKYISVYHYINQYLSSLKSSIS